jgi:hypothetical protein
LVVNVVKDVFPKHIQRPQRNQKPSNTHPQPVRKRRHGERDDEDGRDARHEHD